MTSAFSLLLILSSYDHKDIILPFLLELSGYFSLSYYIYNLLVVNFLL